MCLNIKIEMRGAGIIDRILGISIAWSSIVRER